MTQLDNAVAGCEDSGRGPWAKKRKWPLEVGKGMDYLLEPWREHSPDHTLFWAQWDPFRILDFQHYKVIYLYLIHQILKKKKKVTVATGSYEPEAKSQEA